MRTIIIFIRNYWPILDEEMPDASHVRAVDEEVWRQRHTVGNVVLAGHPRLQLQLDLSLVPTDYL